MQAQIGGRHVYDFLNLTPAPRIAALGGELVSTLDDDVNLAAQNPGLINDSMDHRLTLSYVNYLADIGYGYAAYSQQIPRLGFAHAGIQYINYGSFDGADIYGNPTQTFRAGEWAFITGLARPYGPFSVGVNLKLIYSRLADGFASLGAALDLGASYQSKDGLFSAGLVARNAGLQITPYAEGGPREPLPFEVIVGISNQLKYMPFRFSITAIHLETPDLYVEDPNQEQEFDLNGNPIVEEVSLLDKMFRHIIVGGEFLLGDAVRLRGGYNHMRRQELRAENRGGLTGFSLGVGIRLKRIHFDYGYASYGLNKLFNTHHFSVSVPLRKVRTGMGPATGYRVPGLGAM